ncbi:MAG TPA: spore coat U domain-containing protein [Gammaproteobacteria bacterium]
MAAKWRISTLLALLWLSQLAQAAGSCAVAISNLTFPGYDVFNLAPTDTTGAVLVTCTDDGLPGVLNIDISLTLSAGSSGTVSGRQMVQAGVSERLDYNLFRDAAATLLWGETPGIDDYQIHKLKVPKNGSVQSTLSIFARIPPGQDVSAGGYSDSLVLTISP